MPRVEGMSHYNSDYLVPRSGRSTRDPSAFTVGVCVSNAYDYLALERIGNFNIFKPRKKDLSYAMYRIMPT